MCPEIMAMNGHYQKDMDTAPVNKKRWSKSKRKTFLRAQMGKASVRKYIGPLGERQRTRSWPARRSQRSPDPVDGFVPSGAMAPENTTQYLMDLAYTEQLGVLMEAYNVSPDSSMQSHDRFDESVFSMPDSDYDRSLDFQQRDFENVLRHEI